MNIVIPPHHQVVLDSISKSQQVGGKQAIHELYKICQQLFKGEDIPRNNIGAWEIENDAIKIAAVTDMRTGVYVQLSKAKSAGAQTLMTIGKKFAVEVYDATTSSRNTRIFS
jgi:hypothetical protein